MRKSDLFDLASISKVVSTTSAVMKLYDQGLIDLGVPVVDYLPMFVGKQEKYYSHKKDHIGHLLSHTSGLPPFKNYSLYKGIWKLY